MLKKLTFLLCISFFIHFSVLAIESHLNTVSFYQPDKGQPYIEIYLLINGHTLSYAEKENGTLQSDIKVTILFLTDSGAVNYDKYILQSRELKDSTEIYSNHLLDLKRFELENGRYDLEVHLQDMHDSTNKVTMKQQVQIGFSKEKTQLSGIELLAGYQQGEEGDLLYKGGYILTPLITGYYHEQLEQLSFYTEIYPSDSLLNDSVPFLARYFIRNEGKKSPLHNFSWFKKLNAREVNVLFSAFPIKELPTGNYELVMEVRDKHNNLLDDQSAFFQRTNLEYSAPDIDYPEDGMNFTSSIPDEELENQLLSLYPVSRGNDKAKISGLLKSDDYEQIRNWLYYYWQKKNSTDPYAEWKNYQEQLKRVDGSFGNSGYKGYETDRGRVYLQYGPPNDIEKASATGENFPYEIWHYYSMSDGQNDIHFIFANFEGITPYELIHSNARGEPFNRGWRKQVGKNEGDPFDDVDNKRDY